MDGSPIRFARPRDDRCPEAIVERYRQAAFPLRALRQNAMYRITDLDTGENKTLSGRELTDKGLEARLLNKLDSALRRYRQRA